MTENPIFIAPESEIDPLDARTEYHGPFETPTYRITVGGYKVPCIVGVKNQDESWTLILDERFGIDVASDEEISRWMPFVANAMAVAGGYTAFGPNAKPANPFSTRLIGLSQNEFNELKEDHE